MLKLIGSVNRRQIIGSQYRISMLLVLLFQVSIIQCDINTMEEFLENMLSETVYDKRVRPLYLNEYGKKCILYLNKKYREPKNSIKDKFYFDPKNVMVKIV